MDMYKFVDESGRYFLVMKATTPEWRQHDIPPRNDSEYPFCVSGLASAENFALLMYHEFGLEVRPRFLGSTSYPEPPEPPRGARLLMNP